MPNPVSVGDLSTGSIAAGVDGRWWDVYATKEQGNRDRLSVAVDFDETVDMRNPKFWSWNSIPLMEHWKSGKDMPEGSFGGFPFDGTVADYAITIPWMANDRRDDQTKSLLNKVNQTALRATSNRERAFYDVLTNTASFVPYIPLAPDGQPFFSLTRDGSNDRFGISGGNLPANPSGVATAQAVESDFWNLVHAQFVGMLDTEGEPLWTEDEIAQGFLIIHSSTDNEVFAKAFKKENTLVQVVQNVAANENVAATAVSNVLMGDFDVTRWSSPRLATGDWYAFLKGSPVKPVFMPTGPEGAMTTRVWTGNDDMGLSLGGREQITAFERFLVTLNTVFAAIKIDNS